MSRNCISFYLVVASLLGACHAPSQPGYKTLRQVVACVKEQAHKQGSGRFMALLANDVDVGAGLAKIPNTAMDGQDGALAVFLHAPDSSVAVLFLVHFRDDQRELDPDLFAWELRKDGAKWVAIDGNGSFETQQAVARFATKLALRTTRIKAQPQRESTACHLPSATGRPW